MSEKTQLTALRNFSGPDGKHAIGDVFGASATRAEWLVTNGFAKRATKADEKAAAATAVEASQPAAAPKATASKAN